MWGLDFIVAEEYRAPALPSTLQSWAASTRTMSTAHSGIGTPETANIMLSEAVRFLYPQVQGDLFHTKAMCEIDQDAREELMHRDECPDACVFGDINTFWHPLCADVVDQAWKEPRSAWTLLGPAVKSGRAVVRNAYCWRHKTTCSYPSCDLHIAGSSCTDHSGMGDRLALDGHTSIPKLCWIAQRRLLQEAMVMVENVASFPEGQLIEYLGDIYYIETIKLCSSAYWIQKRLRKFILLTHKAKCKRGMVSLEEWLRPLARSLHLTWYDVLTADLAELQAELSWAFARKKQQPLEDAAQNKSSFFDLLNDSEKQYLFSYRTLNPPSLNTPKLGAYSLQQDPSSSFGCASTGQFIHTIIKNVGILFVHSAPTYTDGRWMTPSEVLLCQGFAVGPSAPTIFEKSSSFGKARAARKRENTKGQAGNAMCVPVIGALLLHLCATVTFCTELRHVAGTNGGDGTAISFATMLLRANQKRL